MIDEHSNSSSAARSAKAAVLDFWNAASCGEAYADGPTVRARLAAQARTRYELEPYLAPFARFADGRDKDVLEIGVGMGADHAEWARAGPRSLTGIDLTPRAIDFTRERLALDGLTSALEPGDAEALRFPDEAFDIVYSWGVLHHSPNTPQAIREVNRVLRRGGSARVMIYHARSLVGYMLWTRYALMAGHPGRSLADVYADHLESPGTKAYTLDEARAMFGMFRHVTVRSTLSFGDLLQGAVGQRHDGALLRVARAVWPRWLLRRACASHGLALLIDAEK